MASELGMQILYLRWILGLLSVYTSQQLVSFKGYGKTLGIRGRRYKRFTTPADEYFTVPWQEAESSYVHQYVVTVPIVMNILGRTLNINRIVVAIFLVIGTALSLLLAIADAYNMFVTHTAWMYRGANALSVLIVIDYLLVLPIAGLVSTYSFFTKGTIWKVITKGIILNIMVYILAGLWLIISSFCCSKADFIIIGLCLLCTGVLWCIWRFVNKVN